MAQLRDVKDSQKDIPEGRDDKQDIAIGNLVRDIRRREDEISQAQQRVEVAKQMIEQRNARYKNLRVKFNKLLEITNYLPTRPSGLNSEDAAFWSKLTQEYRACMKSS